MERLPDEVFDEDYLYFYETFLTTAHDDAEAALVARLAGLVAGEVVLDAPCGHGRIARRLAERGARVVGVDRTALFLDRARADAAAAGVALDLRRGDLRALPVSDRSVDLSLNWFTSFGYFDDAGNEAALAELFRVLRPGGRLVLETMNPAGVVRSVPGGGGPFVDVTWRGDDHLLNETTVDLVAGVAHTRHTITRAGRVRTMDYAIRFYPPPELRRLLAAAGFVDVRVVGDGGQPLTVTSRRQIALARRPAD